MKKIILSVFGMLVMAAGLQAFYNRQSSYGKHSKQSWNKPYNHRIQPDYSKRD